MGCAGQDLHHRRAGIHVRRLGRGAERFPDAAARKLLGSVPGRARSRRHRQPDRYGRRSRRVGNDRRPRRTKTRILSDAVDLCAVLGPRCFRPELRDLHRSAVPRRFRPRRLHPGGLRVGQRILAPPHSRQDPVRDGRLVADRCHHLRCRGNTSGSDRRRCSLALHAAVHGSACAAAVLGSTRHPRVAHLPRQGRS
ncbi:hypothetical protein A3Q41_04907 [Rhodococcoides fascians]|uniref:Uncharacterized protein n=1 Tax=Rhodococcoides fascians TaxID=1828 RepID=A0A143QT71_RHOFA|nr:hypothetical protein A3Q41_04907 [Rhodococcus fascians]